MWYQTTEANAVALTDAKYDVWCTSTALSHRVIKTALWETTVALLSFVSLMVKLEAFRIKPMEKISEVKRKSSTYVKGCP